MGYVGPKKASEVIVNGLKCLEYRGYDSSGLALIDRGHLKVVRAAGKLDRLIENMQGTSCEGNIGIGHTRWATHGKPNDDNAHPHSSEHISVVHNGIIENYLELKSMLQNKGYRFNSQTDSEIIPFLIENELKDAKDFQSAVIQAIAKLKGAFAFAAICTLFPDQIVVAKNASPLVIGLGDGEVFLASDIPALLNHTNKVMVLEDCELACLKRDQISVMNFNGEKISKEFKQIQWSVTQAQKEGFKHFMLKEIFEQSRAVSEAMLGRLLDQGDDVFLHELDHIDLLRINKITIIACGTSWHCALVGKFWIEQYTKIPVEVDLASEYRYRNPIVQEGTLLMCISQSGETADTLAALEEAKQKGAQILSICNVMESSIARKSHAVLYTQAGLEIAVASTKAFMTQLCVMAMFSLALAQKLKKLSSTELTEMIKELRKLPMIIEHVLKQNEGIKKIASHFLKAKGFLFLGRSSSFPIALEGALKLKETSYIHAEGYAAGEMKHGPIAMIDEDLPVIALASGGPVLDKMYSNIQEVCARGGRLIAIVHEGFSLLKPLARHTIEIPMVHDLIRPMVEVIPLQLLAYHIADQLGRDVDQPRNLAKSVTVE